MSTLTLLGADGATATTELRPAPVVHPPASPLRSRVAYAAAHVIPRVSADNVPGEPADIDWDATLAFRRFLYGWGLGVADAMDTAQRNMGLDPAATRELITRSAQVAREVGGSVVVGVNTDDLPEEPATLGEIEGAYVGQLHHAEDAGAGAVLMASRHLARTASGPEDYRRVYGQVLHSASQPVILHWLGAAFDPNLAGYFGSEDTDEAANVLIDIIEAHPERVSGVKMSLLDAASEVRVRERLPEQVRMFTGDDFNYTELIGGHAGTGRTDGVGAERTASDALLGAFSFLAPLASSAIQALDARAPERFVEILEPTTALSRHVFCAPTSAYKTGVAFMSWLNGHQRSPRMVGGLHAARSLVHCSDIVRLANDAGALEHPELARDRWHGLLAVNGVEV